MTTRPSPATDRRHRRHRMVAREHHAGYDARRERDRSVAQDTGTTAAPSSRFPVLAEVPELADPLQAFAQADQLLVHAVLALADLLDADEDRAAETTGVGTEHWLALTGAAPRLERRTWIRAARLLNRLPQLRSAVAAGTVSGGQLRALTIALRGTPPAIDHELDAWLADAAHELHRLDADPDALVDQARQALLELTDQLAVLEEEADVRRHLNLQPRLDGTGGTFSGSEDAYGFAMLEAATRPRPDQTDLDTSRARADNLQRVLHGVDPGPPVPTPPDLQLGGADRPEAGDVPVHRSWAEAAADAAGHAAAHTDVAPPGLAERIAGYAQAGGFAPPRLLVRAELSTLLDQDRMPTDLLIALTGGRLRVTSEAARALLDAHGASSRLIITDQGRVVGVGRAARCAPGWVGDATLALHHTCTEPLCDRPALGADIDHARAWVPQGDSPRGHTDLDTLGPLCLSTNRDRLATGWHPHQHDSGGVRTWTHPRTGLSTTSVPATWRPPSRHPPPPKHREPPGAPGRDTATDDLPF